MRVIGLLVVGGEGVVGLVEVGDGVMVGEAVVVVVVAEAAVEEEDLEAGEAEGSGLYAGTLILFACKPWPATRRTCCRSCAPVPRYIYSRIST